MKPIQTPKRKVALYIRVSTQDQKTDGYGLEAQRAKLLEYVNGNTALNLETKKEWIFEDAHTGSSLNRPQLDKLREQVKANKFDAVLVCKIDRLSRSLKHLLMLFEEMEANETSFISIQENLDFCGPIGKLVFQMFGAIAQFERELIKGRTMQGRIASAEAGNYTGSKIPYGYAPKKNIGGKGKKLITIPKEKKVIQEIFNWYVYEDLGFGGIAKRLNNMKVPIGTHSRAQQKYNKWTTDNVGTIIKNPIYKGLFIANKKNEDGRELPKEQWTVVKFPHCISKLLFQQAQNQLGVKLGGYSKRVYILSGKLVDCDLEKSKKFVGAMRSKGGHSYRRKQFEDEDGQWNPVFEVPGKQLDEYVIEKIKLALQDPKYFIERYLSEENKDKTKIDALEEEIERLEQEMIDTHLRLDRAESAYENGTYSEDQLNEKSQKYTIELDLIQSKLDTLNDELRFLATIDLETNSLIEASRAVKYEFDNLSDKQKQKLVGLFIDRVEMRRTQITETKKEVNVKIVFKFNPQHIKEELSRVRTLKALTAEENSVSSNSNTGNGAASGD
jgi:site-specific DNA recombinase